MVRPSRAFLGVASLAVVATGAMLVADGVQLRERQAARAAALTLGDPALGQGKVAAYGCGACHQIPGVAGATGQVGPSLKGFAGRTYVAGRLSNSPGNVEAWVSHPRRIDPQTAMPELGVTPADARDIAAYLYTLR
ncbi:c-type cytochrome [Caulobacter sp. LARHSG274]